MIEMKQGKEGMGLKQIFEATAPIIWLLALIANFVLFANKFIRHPDPLSDFSFWIQPEVFGVVLTLNALGIYLFLRIKSSFRPGKETPYPPFIWTSLLDQIPTGGAAAMLHAKVALLYTTETKDVEKKIRELAPKNFHLKPIAINAGPDRNEFKKDFSTYDSIVVVHSEAWQSSKIKKHLGMIWEWTSSFSEKPTLLVRCDASTLPGEFLNWTFVQMKETANERTTEQKATADQETIDGMFSGLLERAVNRAHGWRKQSRLLRKALFGSFFLASFVGLISVIVAGREIASLHAELTKLKNYYEYIDRLLEIKRVPMGRELMKRKYIRRRLQEALSFQFNKPMEPWKRNRMREKYNALFLGLSKKIPMPTPGQSSESLSAWVSTTNGTTRCYCQVAKSHPNDGYSCFSSDKSVISCAMKKSAFAVHTSTRFAAWTAYGNEIDDPKSKGCDYLPFNEKWPGIACFSPPREKGDISAKEIGFCFTTDTNEEDLLDERFRNFFIRFSVAASALPYHDLVSNEELSKNCKMGHTPFNPSSG